MREFCKTQRLVLLNYIQANYLIQVEQTFWTKISAYIRDILAKLYNLDATQLIGSDLANIVYSSVKANYNEYRSSNQGGNQEIRQRTQSGASELNTNQGQDVQGQEVRSSDADVLFRAEEVEGSGNLIALHNPTSSNILNSDKLRGLPVPSLAQ